MNSIGAGTSIEGLGSEQPEQNTKIAAINEAEDINVFMMVPVCDYPKYE